MISRTRPNVAVFSSAVQIQPTTRLSSRAIVNITASTHATMSYANGNRPPLDDDDVEEEALVADYQEQVNNYDDGGDLTRADSLTGGPADLRAQLEAAAAPLEYQASLETKFASYDNYCSLFHYILNSEGPVDLEVPSVCET